MEPETPTSTWRWAVVFVIIGGLSATLLWQTTRAPDDPPRTSATDRAASGSSQVASASDEILEGLAGALDAWGRFAVTGDVGLLKGRFDPNGPQYRQLQSEAPGLRAGPPAYSVTIASPEIDVEGEESARVVGTVTFEREGELPQTFEWQITMRRDTSGWRLWSVEER